MTFGILAYVASFFGFSSLVGTVYPAMGYLGFILIVAILVSRIRRTQLAGEGGAQDRNAIQ